MREFDISVEFVTAPNQTFSQVQTTEASRFKSDSLISLHGSLDGERKKGREGGIQGQQKSTRGKSSAGGGGNWGANQLQISLLRYQQSKRLHVDIRQVRANASTCTHCLPSAAPDINCETRNEKHAEDFRFRERLRDREVLLLQTYHITEHPVL